MAYTRSPLKSTYTQAKVRLAIGELRLHLSGYQIVCIIIFIPVRFVECQAGFNNEFIFSLFHVDSWPSVNGNIQVPGVFAVSYRLELKPN